MSVIMTEMDMPKSCVECDKRKFNKCYFNGADYDIENLIIEATKRLKEASYARGYKDGFNDGKHAAYEKSLIHKKIGVNSFSNINLKEITLLSIEEYENNKDLIPFLSDWWWLRSPGDM